MKIKKIVLILFIFMVAVLDVLIYKSRHSYYKSLALDDSSEKIQFLEKAVRVYPFDDLLYFELGKAYLNMSFSSLDNEKEYRANLLQSLQNLYRSLKINPVSHFSHFYLAQSLLYLDFISKSPIDDYLGEFKRAVELVGFNSQLYLEVSRTFLARWNSLTQDEMNFTINIVRDLLELDDEEKTYEILRLWELNIDDYDFLRAVLPETPESYSFYADFLSERSLSIEERLQVMNSYEHMLFDRMNDRFRQAERDFYHGNLSDSAEELKMIWRTLNRIRFYQNLSSSKPIDLAEFHELNKSVLLLMAKCMIIQGHEWGEFYPYLNRYLEFDLDTIEAGELEKDLTDLNVLHGNARADLDNLNRLQLRLQILYNQNRYREMAKLGNSLRFPYLDPNDREVNVIVNLVNLLGDAHQKLGNLYDASEMYSISRDYIPDNIDTLVRLRKNFRLSNDEAGFQALDRRITQLILDSDFRGRSRVLRKGEGFQFPFPSDGRPLLIGIRFTKEETLQAPLVSIRFNGEVKWEDYAQEDHLYLKIESNEGVNVLEIEPLNHDISLTQVSFSMSRVSIRR